MIVIVYGPQGAGKTTHGEELRKHYGCQRIVDGWLPGRRLRDGDLVLTHVHPPYKVIGAKAVDFETARSELRQRR